MIFYKDFWQLRVDYFVNHPEILVINNHSEEIRKEGCCM